MGEVAARVHGCVNWVTALAEDSGDRGSVSEEYIVVVVVVVVPRAC